jgi:geranylgeranyl pyrophosphate synthase
VEALDAVAALARSAGPGGLITGQALDLESAPASSIERVERIHAHKTGALIAAAMEIGAIVAGAPRELRDRARRAGLEAGRAFQIADDLLDISGSEESLGKTPGKDARRGKPTYPAVAGEEAARVRARELTDAALAAMPEARGTDLERLVRFLVERRS